MGTVHLEVERKFDASAEVVVPDLSGVAGVAGISDVEEQDLAATYFDTPDLRLLQAKVTLRRRTGGPDAGWHVKLPQGAGARRELHQPLGRAVKTVPAPVLEPVRGIIGTQPPGPVATVQTHRIVRRLLGGDGRVLAEVADDLVTGTALAASAGEPSTVSTWRELEVELVDGDEALLGAVGRTLLDAGATPSPSSSKVGQVLADRLAALDGHLPADRSGGRGRSGKKRRPTAGELVSATVAEGVRDLRKEDLALRTGQSSGVHGFRVACRRLRTLLAAFRPVLPREQTDPIRAELQWAGRELSGARDGEVALERLRGAVAGQPVELVLGPVAARLQQAQLREHVLGEEQVVKVLSDPRYLRLVDSLTALIAAPPMTALAAMPARKVAARAVRSGGKRLRRAVRAAERASGPDRTTELHEVRKRAKRLRYTAEATVLVLGRPARELAGSMKGVQKVVGQARDTVVTREFCTRLGLAAFAAGENPWTYGRLHALEEARGQRAEATFWADWPAVAKLLRS